MKHCCETETRKPSKLRKFTSLAIKIIVFLLLAGAVIAQIIEQK